MQHFILPCSSPLPIEHHFSNLNNAHCFALKSLIGFIVSGLCLSCEKLGEDFKIILSWAESSQEKGSKCIVVQDLSQNYFLRL